MRDQRKEDGKEDETRHLRIQQAEVDESPYPHHHHASHVDRLTPKPIGEIAKERDREEGQDRAAGEGEKDEVTRLLQRSRAYGVDEDVRGEDVKRRLLGEPQERRLQDLLPVTTDDFRHRG